MNDQDFGAKYGYNAGWQAAKELVYAAAAARGYDDPSRVALEDLLDAMSIEQRNEERAKYLDSVRV